MAPTRTRVCFVWILGFRQSIGGTAGLVREWREALQFSSREVRNLTPMPWNSPWRAQAALIDSLAPEKIVAFAYSWGAGWGLTKLAGHLDRAIDHAILVDPVYRTPWTPAWLPVNPLSMTRFGRVRLSNTLRAEVFRQERSRPLGRRVMGPRRVLDHPMLRGVDHIGADDALPVRNRIREVVIEHTGYETTNG